MARETSNPIWDNMGNWEIKMINQKPIGPWNLFKSFKFWLLGSCSLGNQHTLLTCFLVISYLRRKVFDQKNSGSNFNLIVANYFQLVIDDLIVVNEIRWKQC